MNILISTDQIYLHGGIEKVMATKVNYWANLPDTKVFIVTTEQRENAPCYVLDYKVKLIDLNINYDRSKSYFSAHNLKKSLSHFRRQKKLFKELEPDVIISPNINFDHYWLPFIKEKSKLIKERHSSRYQEADRRKSASFLKGIKFRLDDWIDSRYDHIVVLNEDEKKYVKSDNAVVIPNPVALTDLRADLSKKQVIAAGRLSPVKGFDDLINAWAEVHAEFPDWQLHFYGQDYLGTQAQLQKQIEVRGLNRSVFFKGNVDNLPETMTHYSIYAMTSETECFPMVLLEALSVGLPVVSYDSPHGPKNILLNEQDSFLIPYKKIDIFAVHLKKLIADERLRRKFGQEAIKNVQRFDLLNVMKKWEIVFH
ncbi:hypothetical protein OA84_04725 [Kaistella solincola]|uniref:Glycosyltransferase family 4 protein n=1 Tax=Kaistella solincola TaxID=510955 RepID=A0ABR4ZP79_9FLAO|nr:glycosyltransferase [Kaistella solincola]KIA82877.1 hypothetical protein OA84_04725 [Kaistella solincola]